MSQLWISTVSTVEIIQFCLLSSCNKTQQTLSLTQRHCFDQPLCMNRQKNVGTVPNHPLKISLKYRLIKVSALLWFSTDIRMNESKEKYIRKMTNKFEPKIKTVNNITFATKGITASISWLKTTREDYRFFASAESYAEWSIECLCTYIFDAQKRYPDNLFVRIFTTRR